MPKINRHGKATALTDEQLDQLIAAAPSDCYRTLWILQRWTAARIGEALALTWADVAGGVVTFRRATTKTRRTRQIMQSPHLVRELAAWRDEWARMNGRTPCGDDHLFPGRFGPNESLTRQAADMALRKAVLNAGLVGVSTHSFRRSLAQRVVRQTNDLRLAMEITGHKSLGSLGEYLGVDEDAIAAVLS
ncbi:site-specific integrase [Synechococcus sp. 1G10]|uniref:tyrosine-type recombinase/integrase n=1 Tax=Synechococcus sp. 1G10 TaxID=2025605 RepID=UPI00130353BE|nr:site-specific integrase [Synechococcus sp. 1G10]